MPPMAEDRHTPEAEEEDDGSWVNKELFEDILGPDCSSAKIEVERAVGKGENYLSLLYRTRVEYTQKGSGETKVLQLIVKGRPNGEFMQVFIDEIGFFRREIKIYKDTLPRFYSFADKQLGKDTFVRYTPKYYDSKRPDTLILEDLKQHNYLMANRKNRLDYVHGKMVVENLARLHALSAAYEEKNPGYLSQFDNIMFTEEKRERLEQFMPPQIKSLADEIKKWRGFEKIAEKLEALQKTVVDKLIASCKQIEGGRRVLIHGDCWVNNILFKYSENGELEDLRFVDFQLTREASPALDLNYFIFSSLRTDVRVQRFDDLMENYSESFRKWGKKLGYSGPTMTKEEIYREVEHTLFFGFISVVSTMAIVLANAEDTPDLDTLTNEDVEKGDLQFFDKVYASPAFREAFQNLLPYFDEKGILD